MRGSIIERNGSYRVRVSYQDRDGRRQQISKTAGSKREAEKLCTRLKAAIDNGTYRRPVNLTVEAFLTEWLSSYVKPNLTARSQERYESIVRVHIVPIIGNLPLGQLEPADLQRLYSIKLESGLSARSVKYIHVIAHKALASAVKWGKIQHNPADGVDIPRARRTEMQTWNEEEVAQFLAAARSTHYYHLFYSLLYTGARRGELLGLRWCDCDLIGGQISIARSLAQVGKRFIFSQPKSEKSRRTIALPPSATITLRQLREGTEHLRSRFGQVVNDTDLVFTGGIENKPLRPSTVSRAWETIAKRAGVKVIRLRDARHTHASLMLKQGVPLKVVSERLGHASISITADTYSHIAPGMQESAAKGFDVTIAHKYNKLTINDRKSVTIP